MKDVEVPEYGTVVVQSGEVHDVIEDTPTFVPCWCENGRHRHGERFRPRSTRGTREPHLIGIQKFEMVWEVKA